MKRVAPRSAAARPRIYGLAAIAAIALIVGIVAGAQVSPIRDAVDDLFNNEPQNATGQAIDVINDDYFHTVDQGDLENTSIGAIIDHIKKRYGDRFSHYLNPTEYAQFQKGSSLSGIGVAVSEVPRGLRIATVYKGTPAREAGLEAGDLITAVNGSSIAGKSSDATTALIRGPAGTKVTLTIEGREGSQRDVTLTRREVNVPQVTGRIIEADRHKIGYVRLIGFFQGAHGELRQEIEKLYSQGAEGIVLDLRGNGGGLLTEAVLVSSIFVPSGPIVTTHGRTQPSHTLDATGDALPRHPVVVLINHDSASASEIVTAALEQAGVAKVVGTRSFGKGTFQEVIPLNNGAALDLTVGEYLTRDGTSINGIGIPPQVKAKDNPSTKQDEGRARALQVLSSEL